MCRRWHQVFYQTPKLWRSASLRARPGAEQKWESAIGRRVMQRVDAFVESLALTGAGGWLGPVDITSASLGSLLHQLPRLRQFVGQAWAHDLGGVQHATSQLTHLEVWVQALPASSASTLLASTQLRHPALTARSGMPGAVVAAAAQLQQLTSLALLADGAAAGSFPASELQLLAQLPRLQLLHIDALGDNSATPLELPAPPDFPALQVWPAGCHWLHDRAGLALSPGSALDRLTRLCMPH